MGGRALRRLRSICCRLVLSFDGKIVHSSSFSDVNCSGAVILPLLTARAKRYTG